jgi:uncharacterized membrane-anchored protein
MIDLTKRLARKVPQVTLFFWIIKLLSTALGESTSDYLVNTFNPYLVVVVGFIGFIAILLVQFNTKRYIPWVYWLTIVMVAVFGTMAADVIHVALGVPYVVSTLVFAVLLAIILILWRSTEKTLSIHSITTSRRELFYWMTVSATFALGTAAGDVMAYTAGLGFFSAGLLFIAIFAIPVISYKFFNMNSIFAFWFAYIITRPIGASFADWTGKPISAGGLGFGDGPVAGVLALLIIILVGFLSVSHDDVDTDRGSYKRASDR